jgi:hypothetical protein
VNKPKCFMELCAGTAALSVRLVGGKDAKPPVSRMGAKTGYADVILSVLGLYPGLGAESFVWCEPDDGVRGLLMAYCQPTVLREAAAILRGWKDEEPRALWKRLRAEGKYQSRSARELARWARIVSANELIPVDCESWSNTGKGGTTISINPDHEFYRPMDRLCRGLESMPSLPPTFIARDGRAVTPEEVARYILVIGQTWPHKMDGRPMSQWAQKTKDGGGVCITTLIDQTQSLPVWPPVTITDDARTLTPNKLPEGVIVYIDPPYLETTGYKHDLSREEVIRMARLWSDAGATVCISEQTTIPELIADGWHGVQISFARKGRKRTFSEQQDEYLTINCKPHFIPREPEPMFDDLKVVKKPKVKVVRVSQPVTQPIEQTQPLQTLNLFGGNDD